MSFDVQGQEKIDIPAQEESGDLPFPSIFVQIWPSVDWLVPAHIEKARSLLNLQNQILISSRNIITDTPEIMFIKYLGIP